MEQEAWFCKSGRFVMAIQDTAVNKNLWKEHYT